MFHGEVVCCSSGGGEWGSGFSRVKQSSPLFAGHLQTPNTHTQPLIQGGTGKEGWAQSRPRVLTGLRSGEASRGRSMPVVLGLGAHLPQTQPQGPQSLLSPSGQETDAELAAGRVCLHEQGPGPFQGAE